mmetsp:Transcript_5197/g.16961  ORF Transcript_5197/g.16961 Transcript_5197/m.16961 type:complete len:209 (-) Transcript_5197:845-1471(-)
MRRRLRRRQRAARGVQRDARPQLRDDGPLDAESAPLRAPQQLDAAEEEHDVLLQDALVGRDVDRPARARHRVRERADLERAAREEAAIERVGHCRLAQILRDSEGTRADGEAPVHVEVPPRTVERRDDGHGEPGDEDAVALEEVGVGEQGERDDRDGAPVLERVEDVPHLASQGELALALRESEGEGAEREEHLARKVEPRPLVCARV